ncbi:hypothetical protein D3C80_1490720 [compost metagenome]
MLDPCCLLGRQQVAGGGLEELEHSLVLPGRRIGHIHYHIRAIHRLGQALTGNAVHPRAGRRRDGLVAALTQTVDELRTNEASASDDQDFHGALSACTTATIAVVRVQACAAAGAASLPAGWICLQVSLVFRPNCSIPAQACAASETLLYHRPIPENSRLGHEA